jgi:hypothetical protein
MRKVLVSGVLALGLAATAAPVLTTAAATPAAAAAAPALPAAPGLYHVPIIGKLVLPGLGSLLGHSERHATNVQSANWSGYADSSNTFNSVAASWTEPAVNCSVGSTGGLLGLLGGAGLGGLLGGGPSAASAFWVGLDGYNSSSVEQIGTDSDCSGANPTYYAWYEMYPNPSVALPSSDVVHPGDSMTGWVASNASGTGFYLAINDNSAGWSFSISQYAAGYPRSSAEVVAEAPSSCNLIFCSELSLADFGSTSFSAAHIYDGSGNQGSLASFDAQQITMTKNGRTLAVPSSLSPDGTSFSVTWQSP